MPARIQLTVASAVLEQVSKGVTSVTHQVQSDKCELLDSSSRGMAQCVLQEAPLLSILSRHLCTASMLLSICAHYMFGLLVPCRTPEDAVDATLRMHFRRRTLKTWVSMACSISIEGYWLQHQHFPWPPAACVCIMVMLCNDWRHLLSAVTFEYF